MAGRWIELAWLHSVELPIIPQGLSIAVSKAGALDPLYRDHPRGAQLRWRTARTATHPGTTYKPHAMKPSRPHAPTLPGSVVLPPCPGSPPAPEHQCRLLTPTDHCCHSPPHQPNATTTTASTTSHAPGSHLMPLPPLPCCFPTFLPSPHPASPPLPIPTHCWHHHPFPPCCCFPTCRAGVWAILWARMEAQSALLLRE